ncbi:hypothetical protein HanIR_Chr16g0814021 [Helianthus annuus]|nr:hypothetical protein HanIR_Chr16g0814021 [Helianthus annuus]
MGLVCLEFGRMHCPFGRMVLVHSDGDGHSPFRRVGLVHSEYNIPNIHKLADHALSTEKQMKQKHLKPKKPDDDF